MGLSIGFSRDSYPDRPTCFNNLAPIQQINPNPNPNPSNYNIMESAQIGKHLLVKIQYPDCTNYEGVKILAYVNTTVEDLLNQKLIDPHFSTNVNFRSPVARFEPTNIGWSIGKSFLKNCI